MEGSAERILHGFTFCTPAPISKWLQHMLQDWPCVGLTTAWSAAQGRTSTGWLNRARYTLKRPLQLGTSWF